MKKISFLLLALFALTAMASAQEPVTLFADNDGGYKAFRIPAILRTQKGTLLAFAEARHLGLDDAFDIDLVVRRSTDNGATWGPMEMVWDDGENTCGNPTPVQDPVTGRIFLMMNWNLGPDEQDMIEDGRSLDTRRIFLTYSDDDGLTWASARDITPAVKPEGWTWHGVGPCHATVKTRAPHKGRIVIPAYGKNKERKGFAYAIYSDDHGQSWHRSDSVEFGSESTVAETSEGSLILNFRTQRSPRDTCRPYAVSTDGGATWGPRKVQPELYEPRCQGSMLNASMGQASTTLLFLNPHNTARRRDLTLSVSRDNGLTWDCSRYIHQVAAYSDIVMLAPNRVGLIYEADGYTKILFQVVNLKK